MIKQEVQDPGQLLNPFCPVGAQGRQKRAERTTLKVCVHNKSAATDHLIAVQCEMSRVKTFFQTTHTWQQPAEVFTIQVQGLNKV